jgi:threonine/homoserine/homoserine lactone efflux protein
MDIDILKSLIVFAFVMSVTPGPNNLMLMASGANFGLLRTIPHMLGVGLGFIFMATLMGLGLIQIFDVIPGALIVLKGAAALYMAFLAYKIATAAPPTEQAAAGTPMRFYQAVLFQWVNPKAIGMAVSSMSLFATDQTLGAVLWVGLVFGAVNLPTVSLWAVLGVQMQRVLTDPKRMRIFNGIMALLLMLSVIPMLRAEL